MRFGRLPVVVLVGAVLAAACSGGGGDDVLGGGQGSPACRLLERLARTAEAVERADVSDPAAFRDALDAAALEYGAAADALREALPGELRDDVDQLKAAAEQNRFEDGFEARANVDEWAEQECPDASSTTTSSGG